MPERIEGDIPDGRNRSRHDWGQLLDGSTWKLTKDEYSAVSSFRSQASGAAMRHGVKAKVSVKNTGMADEYILIQAQGPRDA